MSHVRLKLEQCVKSKQLKLCDMVTPITAQYIVVKWRMVLSNLL